MNILGYKLIRTCYACPEQYDIFKDGEMVGYFRLRHGYFYVETPCCGDKLVYESHPEGDGIFEDHEREKYLTLGIQAIDNHFNKC